MAWDRRTITPDPDDPAQVERAAQALLDDIGNGTKLNHEDEYRRLLTVQLSTADLMGMARAALAALKVTGDSGS